MNISRLFSLLLIICTFSFTSFGQGTIRGNVFDKATGDPVSFANVFLEGTQIGVNTDLNGFYTIPQVEGGNYVLMATFIGYDTARVDISISAGQVITQQLFIEDAGLQIAEVSISAEREIARNEVKISQLSVTPKQISMMPSTGGEPDIIQYLQVLPGVVSTGDAGGQLFIRGGSPVQNKILLDGLPIFNPFHSIGFFSTFETDAIRNVEVLTGGFNAEHGGRISAIVDINTKDGNKKDFSGSVSISPFLAKAFFEGPIVKQTENGGSTSFMLSQKNSIINRTGSVLYPYAAVSDSVGLPFSLNDTYGKLSFINQNGSYLTLFGFNYDDVFNDPAVAKIGWKNLGGGANFKLLLDNSDLVLNGLVGYSTYNVAFDEESGNDTRESQVGSFVGRFDFDYYLKNGTINYGVEINVNNTVFEFTNPFGIKIDENQSSPDIAGFVKMRYKLGRLIVEPGFRAIYYAALTEFSPEPRFGMKYNITDDIRFKFAGGLYSQNLLSTSNERDVVALFSGFLTSPESGISKLGTSELTTSNLQKATHAVGGIELDVIDNLTLNVEAYWKRFDQLIVVNRTKLNDSDPNYTTEEGVAYGADISAKYQLPNFYFWGSYALGYVNRNDGQQIFPTIFDRRHNVNLLANYQFSADRSWELGVRWNYGSGFPFTQTQSFYNFLPITDGPTADVVTSNPDNVGILFSDKRNGGRLPDYHRLDLSLIKKIKFGRFGGLEINFSVTNAYNRANIFYFDRIKYDRVDQLPILPSISLKYKF